MSATEVVDDLTFDSWDTDPEPPSRDTSSSTGFRDSLVKRAQKRTVHGNDDRGWVVIGDTKLNDSKPAYRVRFDPSTKKYVCACYATDYGASRARRVCSHVVAVILYRKAGKSKALTDDVRVENGGEGIDNQHETMADAIDVEAPAGSWNTLTPIVDSGESEDVEGEEDNASVPPVDAAPLPSPRTPRTPSPRDPMWQRYDTRELPAWIEDLRDHQWNAVQEIKEAFDGGAEVVWLDAPTGSGKTLIAELARRVLGDRSLYVCSSKGLQDQFVQDFDYAKVLKGRSNYIPLNGDEGVTCADCTKEGGGEDAVCDWCDDVLACPYERAKGAARRSPLAVVNTAYMLAEANYVGGFSGRGLGIVDECDVLEKELMGFVEFSLGERQLSVLRLQAPKKGSHYTTIAAWMREEMLPAIDAKLRELGAQGSMWGPDVQKMRRKQALSRLRADALRVMNRVSDADSWVRDNDSGPLVLKPVRVDEYGDLLWGHANRWLCMSATIISPDELSESLGLTKKWATVRVPMMFPVENRRIVLAPVANMVAKEKETEWPKMVTGIVNLLKKHEGDRVLVHAVSYALANFIKAGVSRYTNRPLMTYENARSREETIDRFRKTPGAVLIAPSLDRGVDLKGDDCRVVIVAKVPFPYLGDKQVSARSNGPGGKTWYAVQTVRTLVQMTGRGVRSADDWCVTYVLDGQFRKNVWKRHKGLFPEWWREAVEDDMTLRRELMREPEADYEEEPF